MIAVKVYLDLIFKETQSIITSAPSIITQLLVYPPKYDNIKYVFIR